MAKLVLDNISKYYHDTPIVRELSLSIEPGDFIALLGPSGCGKTTVLRCIAGFEHLNTGRILLGDKTLSAPDRHIAPEQRQMSMVFQSYALWPHMTVADNVGYSLKLKGVRGSAYKKQINEALDAVNMQHLLHRMPSELSGGQRQRVALARCLVSAPQVILLDEPLANLDRHLRSAMEEIFREFHRKSGTTFVYVTHDQHEAMAMANRIAVMNQGQIIQCDTPEALYQYPETEWAARFIGQGAIVYTRIDTTPRVGAERVLHGKELMRALRHCADGYEGGATSHQAILIRPQHVRPISDGGDSDGGTGSLARVGSGLQATIAKRLFKGEHYHYQATLTDGQQLDFFSEQSLEIGKRLVLEVQKGLLLKGK
ncbi:MAG: ABC transporter ATP-binding protein [Alcaligenaceae bacterium]|nr:ABC transporter ATP-binding protein [Alcaligenaceae bacterium]